MSALFAFHQTNHPQGKFLEKKILFQQFDSIARNRVEWISI